MEWRTRAGRRLRERVLRRDGYTCVRCGRRGRGLEVHHRRRLADGGRHDLGNLETLCLACHRGEHGAAPPRVTTPID